MSKFTEALTRRYSDNPDDFSSTTSPARLALAASRSNVNIVTRSTIGLGVEAPTSDAYTVCFSEEHAAISGAARVVPLHTPYM